MMNNFNTAQNLIILQHAPTNAAEPLDLVLALAAFEQDVAILLKGDGLFYALKNQQPRLEHGKSVSKILSALPMYDCDKLYYFVEDIQHLGLNQDQLDNNFAAIDKNQQQQLIASSKHCMSF